MLKLLLGRLLPMGAAGLLLKSSISPIKPALAAFRAATDALAGESTAHVDANFPGADGTQPPQLAVPSAKGVLGSLLGKSDREAQAKAELERVIADVKYHGHPPADVQQPKRSHTPPPAIVKKHGPEVKLGRVKGR